MLTRPPDKRDMMFIEVQHLLVFGNWPLNHRHRGKWEGQYYPGVYRESANLHLEGHSLEDVTLSTMILHRRAGIRVTHKNRCGGVIINRAHMAKRSL